MCTMYTMYNIVIKLTKIQPFYTLRTSADIVFSAFFNDGYHPTRPPRGPQT